MIVFIAITGILISVAPSFAQQPQTKNEQKHHHGYVALTGGKGHWDNIGIEAAIIFPRRDNSRVLNSRFLIGGGGWTSSVQHVDTQFVINKIMNLDQNKQKGILQLINKNTPSSPEYGEGGGYVVGGIRIVKGLYMITKVGGSTEKIDIESQYWEWKVTNSMGQLSYYPYYEDLVKWKHLNQSYGLRYLTNRGVCLTLGIEYYDRTGFVGSIGVGF
jgi:hypothetical protein